MSKSSERGNSADDEERLVEEMPKAFFWETVEVAQWEGFWLRPGTLTPTMRLRSRFEARDDDVFLASSKKTGTTWLKSLALCIMKNHHHEEVDVLALDSPHSHVPTIELPQPAASTKVDIYDTSAPRLLHTHLPYAMLPDLVKNSAAKIVYIARSPRDTLISMWHFYNSILRADQEPFPLEKAVDCFCSGVHPSGPFFEHVAQYWVESEKRPEKLLFVKYEELKSDPKGQVSRIAEFLGRPFVDEGEVDEVLWRCSLERMKNLEVTKTGTSFMNVANNLFFRKGEVGDWKNYLTSEMEQQIHQSIALKLEALGLFL